MKVAFFFGAINRGGAETLVYDVCKRRRTAPFDIVCLYRKDGGFVEDFRETGVCMCRLEQNRNPIRLLFSLRKTILKNKIDIVHAQTGFNALLCLIALQFTPVKLVTTFHGFSFASAPKWRRWLVYHRSKRLICVSGFEKDYYVDKWHLSTPNKFCVVYNGIDFSKLTDPTPDHAHPVLVEKDSLNMIMVGSFRSGRSQSFICRVANELNKKEIPFHLFFVGRKEPEEPWRYDDCVEFCANHGLSQRVHFLGNRTDVPFLLKQMDLFIYASEHDTFGIAVLEALASSLPVIVNDWAVMKEITCDGSFASLYETDNTEDCVSRIIDFCQKSKNDSGSFQNQIRLIADAVRARYSIDNHINELYKVYLSC